MKIRMAVLILPMRGSPSTPFCRLLCLVASSFCCCLVFFLSLTLNFIVSLSRCIRGQVYA